MPRNKKTEDNQTEGEKKNSQANNKNYIFAVGRRREASARVRLYTKEEKIIIADKEYGKGSIIVNQKPVEEYFAGEVAKTIYTEPFRITNNLNKFITTVVVSGGGQKGQLGALVLGVARALDKFDKEKNHGVLKKRGLLTRDARTRERRKVGTGGKARRMKQSPKR